MNEKKMTNEKAIDLLDNLIGMIEDNHNSNYDTALRMGIKVLKQEQWKELKETITELRDNSGTSTQQEVCKFLVNYMDVLEKQIQEPQAEIQCGHSTEEIEKSFMEDVEAVKEQLPTEHWIYLDECANEGVYCSKCHKKIYTLDFAKKVKVKFCPNCGADMRQPQADGDLISRQAVLDTEYQVKVINDIEYVMLSEVQMKARKLPSVAIPSAEPSGDLISRQAVLDIAKSSKSNWIDNSVLFKRVNALPSVKQEPTGYWFAWKPEDDVWRTTCSECGEETRTLWNYCPNCGARMV